MVFAGFYDRIFNRDFIMILVWSGTTPEATRIQFCPVLYIYTGLIQLVHNDVHWGVFYLEVK